MKKIILAALVVASLFASCSSEKTFKKKDGSTITAKPYGWASKENKVEGVNYELNDKLKKLSSHYTFIPDWMHECVKWGNNDILIEKVYRKKINIV